MSRTVILWNDRAGSCFQRCYLQPQATVFSMAYRLAIITLNTSSKGASNCFYLGIDECNNLALVMSGVGVGSWSAGHIINISNIIPLLQMVITCLPLQIQSESCRSAILLVYNWAWLKIIDEQWRRQYRCNGARYCDLAVDQSRGQSVNPNKSDPTLCRKLRWNPVENRIMWIN